MEKPILFNTAMVQAILDGRKICTRRIIKSQPKKSIVKDTENRKPLAFWKDNLEWVKPPYQVGDILWVRETWTTMDNFTNYADLEIDKDLKYLYKCDNNGKEHAFVDIGVKKWKPSIHMPKVAARIFLKVTDVRIERLQDMTTKDVLKEGIYNEIFENYFGEAKNKLILETYENLWNGIYNNWNENPWVWVIEFEREKNYESISV